MIHSPDELSKADRAMLSLLDRSEALMCDGFVLRRLIEQRLIRRAPYGWTISPAGRLRLHMRR